MQDDQNDENDATQDCRSIEWYILFTVVSYTNIQDVGLPHEKPDITAPTPGPTPSSSIRPTMVRPVFSFRFRFINMV